MNFKNQLILAFVLFSLGGFAYWNEYKRRPEVERKELADRKILPLKGVAVSTFQIDREGKSFLFSCDDFNAGLCKPSDPSHWKIVSPTKVKGDDSNINSMLTSISNWDSSEKIDLSADSAEKRKSYLRDYGLVDTKPGVNPSRLKFTLKEGKTLEILVGSKHSVNESFFVAVAENGKIKDEKIYLLPTYQWTATDHDFTFWRDKKILSLNQTEVTSVEIISTQNRNAPIQLEKDNSEWKVVSGKQKLPGDMDNIGSLISGALFLTAKGIYAESKVSPEAKKILAASKKTIILNIKTAKTEETLEVYERTFKDGKNKASQAYATSPHLDPLFELETTSLDRLTKTFDELRVSRLVPSMDRFSLNFLQAEIQGDDSQRVTLIQKEGKWLSTSGVEVDPERVKSLLDLLTTKTLGPRMLDRKNYPKAPGQALLLKLGTSPTDIRFDFAFWREKETGFFMDQRHSDFPVFSLTSSATLQLPWTPKSFGNPKPDPKDDKSGILMDATQKSGK